MTPAEQLYNALKVITETDATANWLAVNDPKAMEQANAAMTTYESERRYFATVRWVAEDVMESYAVTAEQAEDFLANNSRSIEDAMTTAGFEAIDTCALMDGLKEKDPE